MCDYIQYTDIINQKKIIMKNQRPAGKKLSCGCNMPIVGTRIMKSNNSTITPTLRRIDNVPYKGNPVLLAQR